MKLEVGKTYVLFNGEVQECTRFSEATDDDIFFSHYGRFLLGVMYYHEDGTFADGSTKDLSVSHEYKEETTVEYKTFGKMTDEEKGALLLAQYEGKTVEYWSSRCGGWEIRTEVKANYNSGAMYRVKVEPVIRSEETFIWAVDGTFAIKYDVVNGVTDCSTVTMTKRASK
jgi:hypothetical protein